MSIRASRKWTRQPPNGFVEIGGDLPNPFAIFRTLSDRQQIFPGPVNSSSTWTGVGSRSMAGEMGLYTSGGGVMHTLNLRLAPDELGWIAADAEDRFIVVDDILLPLFKQFAGLHRFERVIVFAYSGAPVAAPQWRHFNQTLDHVFYRGVRLIGARALTHVRSSDHIPLAADFDPLRDAPGYGHLIRHAGSDLPRHRSSRQREP
jgi:hypothetical protein